METPVLFYASFIVGFEELVARIFNEHYPSVSVVKTLNGAVLYEALNEAIVAPFLNNQFVVFKQSEETNVATFMSNLSDLGLKRATKKQGFRIIVSDSGELVSVDDKVLSGLERKIEKETGNYPKRHKPDIEYWVLKRSEDVILFMERLGKHKSFDKILEKGELREDLCYFLNYLSKPSERDVFLDCFCGSGAIIKSRVKSKFNMIFGVDTDKEHISELRKTFKGQNNVIFKNIDFFENSFDNDFIDKIVTDPPWGFHEDIGDFSLFYQKLFDEATRILKAGGLLVLLSARKKEVKNINISLNLLEEYNILVSGKKAGVYAFQK